MLQPFKDDVLSEVGHVCEGLLRGQEPEVVGSEIVIRDASSIEAMLKNDAQPVGGFGKLGKNALLQVIQAGICRILAALEDNDGTETLFVVGPVEIVAQLKGVIGVRLVHGVVVEVIDGDTDVMGRVQKGWLNVTDGESGILNLVDVLLPVMHLGIC